MSTATIPATELSTLPPTTTSSTSILAETSNQTESNSGLPQDDFSRAEDGFSTLAIPNGGYGWVIVLCCSTVTFWGNGMINCWGVLQTALLDSTLSHVPTSTVSFIGSTNLACGPAFGLVATRLGRRFGTRFVALGGVLLMGGGLVAASFCTHSVAGLFVTIGLITGIGISGTYTICNALPIQYFSSKLGLANGLVKLGGGIGGTVMALAQEAMVRRVGIAWTFRIQGFMTIAVGVPAAWAMKERVVTRYAPSPVLDWSMFRNVPFAAMFISGTICTFALFVPPYYLPLFVQSLGRPASTGAAVVAAFNACNGLGRFCGGPLCDAIGATNTFVIVMLLNAISMLAIWPVSSTLAPLIIFAILNGMANGAYFTVFPTQIANIFGPGRAAAAMSMSITGWTVGYLMGSPIAGYLLEASGGKIDPGKNSIAVYRAAIFYAGGVALLASLFALFARFKMSKSMVKRV